MTPDEHQDPVQGLHRVRIIPPDAPGLAPAMAYTVEIDGRPVYPSSVKVHFAPHCYPEVTLTLPAVIENTEVLAWLTPHPLALFPPADPPAGDADEPPLGCREDC